MKEICNKCKHLEISNFKFDDNTRSAVCSKHKKFLKFIKTKKENIKSPRFCRNGNSIKAITVKAKNEKEVSTKRIRKVENLNAVKEARKRFLKGEKLMDIAKELGIASSTLNSKFIYYRDNDLINDEKLLEEIWRDINEQSNITG